MYCSDSLEYSYRNSRIYYKRCNDYSGYGSSLILIKGCRISVRADTTYVVSLVEHVVVHFVRLFVMYLVSILVISFCKDTCKEPCNTLCRLCLLLLNGISKKYI